MTYRGNISKRARRVRPVKPEFALTGVGIGLPVGLLTGFAVEMFWKQKMIVMVLGGLLACCLALVSKPFGSGGGCSAFAQPKTPNLE